MDWQDAEVSRLERDAEYRAGKAAAYIARKIERLEAELAYLRAGQEKKEE